MSREITKNIATGSGLILMTFGYWLLVQNFNIVGYSTDYLMWMVDIMVAHPVFVALSIIAISIALLVYGGADMNRKKETTPMTDSHPFHTLPDVW